MAQQTFNPYPSLATQFSDGLDRAVNPAKWVPDGETPPETPTVENIVFAIRNYILDLYYAGSEGFNIIQEDGNETPPTPLAIATEVDSVAYYTINNYINGSGINFSLSQFPFILNLLGPPFTNGLTVDSLKDRILEIEENIPKSLTNIEQQPLFFATMIGQTAYDYFMSKINSPIATNWTPYFETTLVSPIVNLPYWITSSMQGKLIGATNKGMITPTYDIVTSTIVSSLISALIITCDRIIFKAIPKTNSLAISGLVSSNKSNQGCVGCSGNGGSTTAAAAQPSCEGRCNWYYVRDMAFCTLVGGATGIGGLFCAGAATIDWSSCLKDCRGQLVGGF